jgi:coatomer subunit beta'
VDGLSIQKSIFIKFYEQTLAYEGHTHYIIPSILKTLTFSCLPASTAPSRCDVLSGNLQTISDPSSSPSTSFADGSRLPPFDQRNRLHRNIRYILAPPNGRFVTVVGDSEYIIYTSLAWRNKSFGNGISFAWAPESNTYAVLESKIKLKIYKNFRERPGTGMKGSGSWLMESFHGGTLLGARCTGFVMFRSGEIVRRIDVD